MLVGRRVGKVLMVVVVASVGWVCGACSSGGGRSGGGEQADMGVGSDGGSGDIEQGDVMTDGGGEWSFEDPPAVSCSDSGEPGQYVSSASNYEAVASGTGATCGLKTDGEIVCWGDGAVTFSDTPQGDFEALFAGDQYACALDASGIPACWGMSGSPIGDVPSVGSNGFREIEFGAGFGCGLRQDDTLDCWGADNTPTDAPSEAFHAVEAGTDSVCGLLKESGRIRCWGSNERGQTEPPEGRFTAIQGGGLSYCALRADGTFECWGLLEGTEPADLAPVAFVHGGANGCVLSPDGVVDCWKLPGGDYLIDGEGSSCFTELTVGTQYACGLRADGRIECFGEAPEGQMDVP